MKTATVAAALLGIAFTPAAAQVRRALPRPVASPPSAGVPATAPAPATAVQRQPAPATQPALGGGVAQLSAAAVCGSDNTPRIGNVNGTQSGIVFRPGSQLNIAGCGFGNVGRVYLNGGGTTVLLKIDSWGENNIRAQVDAGVGGVPDLSRVTLHVQPSGAPGIGSSDSHSFAAARETRRVPLPASLGIYSQIYAVTGALKTVAEAEFTRVERDFTYRPFCPVVQMQSQLVDAWPIDSKFFEQGFAIDGVVYVNRTNQNVGDGDTYQDVMVGSGAGGAVYDASRKRVIVTFQAHSTYTKQHAVGTSPTEGSSRCTAAYLVSLTVSGPRGLSPFK